MHDDCGRGPVRNQVSPMKSQSEGTGPSKVNVVQSFESIETIQFSTIWANEIGKKIEVEFTESRGR